MLFIQNILSTSKIGFASNEKMTETISGQLREIIAELDPRLTEEDLDGIIEEIDEDGSGTMDFDEFCQMMMST